MGGSNLGLDYRVSIHHTPSVARPKPLPSASLHIVLALLDGALHGYALMGRVAELSDGAVRMRPGTLYCTLNGLVEDGLIEETTDQVSRQDRERRRYYQLTAGGRACPPGVGTRPRRSRCQRTEPTSGGPHDPTPEPHSSVAVRRCRLDRGGCRHRRRFEPGDARCWAVGCRRGRRARRCRQVSQPASGGGPSGYRSLVEVPHRRCRHPRRCDRPPSPARSTTLCGGR